MSHTPPVVASPSVLRLNWETLARLASRRSKTLDLDACPTPTFLHRFCDATDKLKHILFWGSNQENVVMILRLRSFNRSCWFYGSNRETRATSFEEKSGETVTTGFEVKSGEIVIVVLMLNHWQTVDLGFEAQPRNSHSSSPRARCRPHTASSDLRSSGHWVPDLCLTIPSSPHQIYYSCRDTRRYPSCRTCHLYTIRQGNAIL
jgi:hypothetical protein